MKILHVIHSLDTASGGPSNALRLIVRAQVGRGHRCGVLATDVQSRPAWRPGQAHRRGLFRDHAFEGAGLFVAHGWGSTGLARRWRHSPEARSALGAALADPAIRPDVVHVHGLFSHITTIAPRIARKWGVPVVLRPCGGLLPWSLGHGRAALKSIAVRTALRWTLSGTSAIHATSEEEARECAGHAGAIPVVTIPLGVAAIKDSQESRGVLAEKCIVPGRYVLFLSRLHRKKNPALLTEAFADVAGGSDWTLVLAGADGGERGAVEAVARGRGRGRVLLLGHVEGALRDALIVHAGALVLPSESENFGVVVAEALSAGTPVVASPGVGTARHVEACGGGLVVAAERGALGVALRRVFTGEFEAARGAIREYAARHLSIAATVEELDVLYARLCLRRPGR